MLARKKLVPLLYGSFRSLCSANIADSKISDEKIAKRSQKGHSIKLGKYFESKLHLKEIKEYIPQKHIKLKRRTKPENLYLIDSEIAKCISRHVLTIISTQRKDQVICETNAGLGLIASELLDNGVEKIRLYESCPEFRDYLKEFSTVYPNRVELFTKDIYQLQRIAYLDKIDKGHRVEFLLRTIPAGYWHEDPVMSIVGSMPQISFISFLIKMLALQSKVVFPGRIQLFAIMKPEDYVIFTAGPHQNLHTYKRRSVVFNLLCDIKILEKFPRKAFLPWEVKKARAPVRYAQTVDPDCMYLVNINFKKQLPVEVDQLLPLYYFINQFFGQGSVKVIPTMEKWFPGSGGNLIVPTSTNTYSKDMNIFTKFGELSPEDILAIFREIIRLPNFESSPFASMIESELVKSETVETTLAEDIEYNQDITAEVEKPFL